MKSSFSIKYITLFWMLVLMVTRLANAQDLSTFINKALENNPEIKKMEFQYNISSEKVNETSTLPNTEFGAGYFVSEPETRTGPQKFKLSVKQMIPWFGTITARENYQTSLADIDYETLSITKRKLTLQVAQSYYKLYALQKKQEIITENQQLLNTYKALALNALEVNKATAVDVLKLEMKRNELESKLEELTQAYQGESAVFQQLLNDKSAIITWDNIEELPITETEDLVTDSLVLLPELMIYDKLYESVTQSELMNQKDKNPMLGFGVDYINVTERTDMVMDDNGKDILMPMISLSIPIFNNTHKSRTKQHSLEQEKIQAAKEERYNTLEAMLTQSVSGREAVIVKYNTLEKNIDQAKHAETILMKSYENNTLNFKDLLEIQDLKLGFQMNRIEAVLQFYLQTTMIQYLSNSL